MQTLFILSLSILFYTFIGYGIIMYLWHFFSKKKSQSHSKYYPKTTLLIAAYNEENSIADKIRNSLALRYPGNKFEIVVVTDGSDDKTPDIVRSFPQVKLYHRSSRKGKIHAINRVMPFIDSEICIFSDANVMINEDALFKINRHFADKNVAAVSGEKVVLHESHDQASASGEGLYWKYESFLKKMDFEMSTLIGSAGELMAVRKSCFKPISKDTIIEDFVMTMGFVRDGYIVAYEPEARAQEYASASIEDELKRKIRISAGGIQAILRLIPLLNFFKYGRITFQYISHRVLRWTLAPLSLICLFISNAFLIPSNIFFQLFFIAQILFYAFSIYGFLNRNTKQVKFLSIPFYFSFMNYCVVRGWIEYLRKTQSVTWEKAKRILPEPSLT